MRLAAPVDYYDEVKQPIGDQLAGILAEVTPMQRLYLLRRWTHNERHDRDAALALGLHPQTPYNWRFESPTFRKAEEAVGQVMVSTVQAAMYERARQQIEQSHTPRRRR